MPAIDRIPELVTQLYEIVGKLESAFPDRKFTPDGHLVGSIGEVLAAHRYGLTLFKTSKKGHDASDRNGRLVQIKATQVVSVALRSEPKYLVVLKLLPNGQTQEIYNGPGRKPWSQAGKLQSNGQRAISLAKLGKLNVAVAPHERIQAVTGPAP